MTYINTTDQIAAANFSQYKVVYIPSAYENLSNDIVNGINDEQARLVSSGLLKLSDLRVAFPTIDVLLPTLNPPLPSLAERGAGQPLG